MNNSSLNNSTIRTSNRRFFIITLMLYMFHDFPIIGYYTPAMVYAVLVAVVNIATLSFLGNKLYWDYFMKCLPLSLILLLCIVRDLFTEPTAALLNVYVFFQVLLYPIIGLYIVQSKDYKLAKTLFWFVAAYFIITSLTTYYGLTIYPNACRALASAGSLMESGIYDQYMKINIGGFSFIYRIVLVIVLFITAFKYKMMNKVLTLAAVVLFALVVLKSGYTFAILMAAVGFSLIIMRREFDKKQFVVFSIIASVGVIIAWSVLPTLFSFLSDSFGEGEVAARFEQMSSVMESGSMNSLGENTDMYARNYAYTKSFDAFLKTFPIGSWDLSASGGHSYILDNAACFGLLGLLFIYFQFKRMYKLYISPFKNKPWTGYLFVIFLEVIVLAFLNTVLYSIVIVLYIPSLCVLIGDREMVKQSN